MSKDWDKLVNVGKQAPLKETTKKITTFSKAKLLNAVPTRYFDAHHELKENGKTSLDFSRYILEALREKLEKEGAL